MMQAKTWQNLFMVTDKKSEYHGMILECANPADQWMYTERYHRRGGEAGPYVIHFDRFTSNGIVAYGDCLQDALDEAADYIEDRYPGYYYDPEDPDLDIEDTDDGITVGGCPIKQCGNHGLWIDQDELMCRKL